MSCRAFVVGGTHTGVGKTSVSVGLMHALAERGLSVQPFKVGPDFIDPSHHRAASGRWSHNLDAWMLERATNEEIFARHCQGADAAVVEGVMGLFDGASGSEETGSTAEMARWLGLPCILVVDAWTMARSVAAMVKGYVEFDDRLEVAGVILNRVAGPGHADLMRQALAELDEVDLLGAIPRDEELQIPERHLGLHTAGERTLPQKYIHKLGRALEENVDLDGLLAQIAAPVEGPASERETAQSGVRLGVAADDAFSFYYRDNLDRLEALGAELVEFSPVRDPLPEGLDGVYLGGGYPEVAAADLSANRAFFRGIVDFIESGGPVYAECGGLMVLGRWIETDKGERYQMAGVFPWGTRMADGPKLDYAEVETAAQTPIFPAGATARGHIFHYSEIAEEPDEESLRRCYHVEPLREGPFREGYAHRNVLASYVHLHFGSNPAFARSLIEACQEYAASR